MRLIEYSKNLLEYFQWQKSILTFCFRSTNHHKTTLLFNCWLYYNYLSLDAFNWSKTCAMMTYFNPLWNKTWNSNRINFLKEPKGRGNEKSPRHLTKILIRVRLLLNSCYDDNLRFSHNKGRWWKLNLFSFIIDSRILFDAV